MTTWTPKEQPFVPWSVETPTTVAWPIEEQPYLPWSVEALGDIPRITEDAGYVRITEQGVIRIIEHFDTHWSNETPTVNPWTKE